LTPEGLEGFELLVRVRRIESIRDPEGNYGKRIELVEERPAPSFNVPTATEEARMVQEMLRAMQAQLPMLRVQTNIMLPKLILFLTESEYELLGVDFQVNQLYEVKLSNGVITFKRVEG